MRLSGFVVAAVLACCAPAIASAQTPPAPATPSLLETTWVTIELGGVPVPLTPAERQPSLQFVAGGHVTGSDGCNRVRATYKLAGSRITFGPIAATRMACSGSESVAGRFATALKSAVRWRLAAGRLQFYGADDTLLVAFEAGRGGATAGEEPPPGPAAAPTTPPASAGAPLVSRVFDWASLQAVPIPSGERRQVLDGPTATVDLLHVHVTTLAVGKASGEAVRHLQEEVLIVKDGDVEVSLDGTTQKVGPGSILFFAAGAVTRLRNAGTTPATYYVVYFKTPKTPKA